MTDADIIVIGGGIAGVSAASEVALDAKVILLERESAPGYHSTGRSAAYFAAGYGNAVVRAVTAASESFFYEPPDGFTDVPLINSRSAVFVASPGQEESAQRMLSDVQELTQLNESELVAKVSILQGPTIGLYDERGGDIDVDALLQGFARRYRDRGGELMTNQNVQQISFSGGIWQIDTNSDSYTAATIVNAAGAWADSIATLAGVGPLGIQPMRRTALLVDAPGNVDMRSWPMVADVDEQFYFKPDAGQILISPADETPSPPCDAQPEELDVAIAVDRFMRVTNHEVKRVNHQWAGLRSFAPDRTFVLGQDPRVRGFFWLAGQGGYGVQTSPGMSQLVAHVLTERSIDDNLVQQLPLIRPDRLIS